MTAKSTPHVRVRRARLAAYAGTTAITLLLAALAGCDRGTGDPVSAPATRAEQWFAAYHSAVRQGMFNAGRFYDPDTTLDLAAVGNVEIRGREATIGMLGALFEQPEQPEQVPAGSAYVSSSGAIEQIELTLQAEAMPHLLVSIDEVGQTGLTRQTFAVSELAWRAIRPDDERIAHAHLVAQQWAAAWRDGNAAAMDALYARDAVVADSLAGVRATSRTDVIALPTSAPGLASLAGVTIPSMPELGGPAVFVLGTTAFDSWTTHPIETIVALGATHSDDGCPGGVAVELQLGQDGRIVHEQRYHRIADLARCSGGSLPRGWWDDIPIPSPIAFEPTGTMELGGTEIAMFNSTAGLDGLVRWAYGRFARARLKPPVVGQVAFHQPSIDLCQGVGGLAAGDQLSLCFTETSACADRSCSSWTPAARSLTLHELGHTWLSAYTDSEAHATFLRASRQPSWADSAQPRAGRGVELAASVLAWGLADQPFGIERAFADRPCQQRVALFRTLTGQPPLNDECVAEEPAGEAAPAGG